MYYLSLLKLFYFDAKMLKNCNLAKQLAKNSLNY
jgi:hypothetical protein